MGCVYQARNKVNGKCYIGKTVASFEKRKRRHQETARAGSLLYFHNALRKYGFDTFEWRIIMRWGNEETLNEKEQFCIRFLNTKAPNGYNLTDGGDGVSGLVHSLETKAKMSEAHKGIPKSVEHRIKISKSHKGIHPTIETRRKISQAKTGKPSPMKGKNHSLEARVNMSIARKGKSYGPLSPKHKASISTALNSPETKAKCSKATKERWKSTEYRAKRHEFMLGNKYHLGCKDSDETREKKRQAAMKR